jgi:predicted anti-sigma-YlaC factor YlaD
MAPSKGQLCDRARRWASLRVDGELSELETALLDAHLGRCDGCRAFAREADGIAAALRAVAVERLDEPLAIAVAPLRAPRAPRVRALQVAIAAALVLLASVVGSALGVASHSGASSTAKAQRHVAVVASGETADNLRRLRRAGLVQAGRPVPRNRLIPDESV